jgi:hypothetical protein
VQQISEFGRGSKAKNYREAMRAMTIGLPLRELGEDDGLKKAVFD